MNSFYFLYHTPLKMVTIKVNASSAVGFSFYNLKFLQVGKACRGKFFILHFYTFFRFTKRLACEQIKPGLNCYFTK